MADTLSDHTIREAVADELSWTSDVDATHIEISVENGIVTLTGTVHSVEERNAARKAVLRTRGVVSFADDLRVAAFDSPLTDTEIAEAVRDALTQTAELPPDAVKAEVRDHAVILTGTLEWNHQRRAARRAVERLAGVVNVDNRIELTRRPSAPDTEEAIRKALVRNATVDANSITVTLDGTIVTLTGTVASWAEKKQAGHAAWSSPHVTSVRNEIVVRSI